MDAYLDLEFSYERWISVFGIYRQDTGFKQLIGRGITKDKIEKLLEGCRRIVTFNGNCCEIPVIEKRFDINIRERFQSRDLREECRKKKITGRFHDILNRFGIQRHLALRGRDAMNLWYWFKREYDWLLLYKLLDYNREDVMCLVQLHKKLRSGSAKQIFNCKACKAGSGSCHKP
ncbi:MAG: ribonuclease H-like domain-containing protein [Candidatus Omnitrophica bacterium]|nr:ribonuclease H-like domain-containing protein [Candidatus Omnitrophota bacterium]